MQHFETTDPGELTFGQLWSLPKTPGLPNVARVIIDNPQCLQAMPTASATQWGPISPPSQLAFLGLLREPVHRFGDGSS